jgi:hypothetical protein
VLAVRFGWLLRVTWIVVAVTHDCEQCGTSFVPRREHARFCSARCRVAWNRAKLGDAAPEASALCWAVTALGDTIERLGLIRASDRARAFAVVGEAVWWVTIVDGTLVRHHPDIYDAMLGALPADERWLTEQTLGGLRYVRNRMGAELDHVDFICPGNGGRADKRVAAWTWRPVAAPELGSLPPRGRAWEMTRYRAYCSVLAGRPVGEVFSRTAAFLIPTASKASAQADGQAPAPPSAIASAAR